MFAVPDPTAVTSPVGETVATVVRSEDHVAATTSVVPSAFLAVAVALVVCPVNTLERPSVTVNDVGGCGVGVEGLSDPHAPDNATSQRAQASRARTSGL